jgi:multidrug efflux pump subunit AcrB
MPAIGVEPFTINLMTLLGLSLSVGVVVDDAILVLENIYRHRELGKPKEEAALIGSREITFAALAATLSIMAIFLPVAFMKGTIGKFFFQFGVTVSVAVFFSLISALTLTPMLCAFFLNVHRRLPTPPPLYGWPLALLVGLFTILTTCSLRIGAAFAPVLESWAWWLPSVAGLFTSVPTENELLVSAPWWISITATEFILAALLMRFGNVAYWLLDRYFLNVFLLMPTEWVLAKMTSGYAWLLRWSLDWWWLILIKSGVLIAIALFFVVFDILGRELVPSEDQSRMVVHVVCRIGASIDLVDDRLQKCEEHLQDMPEVASFLTTVATEPGQLMTEADIFVQLVPRHQRRRSQQQLMEDIRQKLSAVRDIRIVLRDQSTEGFTAQRGDPVDFAIQGDWERLPRVAETIKTRMAESGDFEDIDSDFRPGMPEARIKPNRDKLAMVGMNMAHLANSLSFHVGGQRIAKYTDSGRRYDVRLRVLRDQRSSPNQLDSILLRAGDKQVPLLDVATIEIVPTLPVINRYNHQRMIEITANPAKQVSQGEAIARAQEIVEQVAAESKEWPDTSQSESRASREIRVVELGNAQAMRETIFSLIVALLFGIIIAYMILAVQFASFVHPFTVLMAMPFAATGALVTLWLTGDTLNMMSMIGLILLMGLVKKNSIILVDYTNQLREEGMPLYDAVVTACPIRLRPILMTSIATVAGAVPAAIGWGPGAETRAPMARGIIGGIVLSTLITLILVPVFYVLLERLRGMSGKLLIAPDENETQENLTAN